MKNNQVVKDSVWKRFLKIIVRVAVVVAVLWIALPTIYVLLLLASLAMPRFSRLEKSTLTTQIVFNNSGLQYWRRVYEGGIVFYRDKNKTVLRHIDSGNEVSMAVISPSFFITPKDKNYFLIGAREGRAYLISKDGMLIREYSFAPVKVLGGEVKHGLLTIDDQNGYPSMGAWLDNKRLFTVNGVFDLDSGQLSAINSPVPEIHVAPWQIENRDCRTDGEGVGFCYHIKCLPNSQVFDTTEYDRVPLKDRRAYMENADIQCLVAGSSESYLIGEKSHPYILVRKNNDQWYGIKAWLTFAGPEIIVNKKVDSMWGRTYWLDYPDKIEKKALVNGYSYKMESKVGTVLGSPSKEWSKITLYNQKDEIVGSISRKDIQLINDRWHGENKILFLSEKGFEVVSYEN